MKRPQKTPDDDEAPRAAAAAGRLAAAGAAAVGQLCSGWAAAEQAGAPGAAPTQQPLVQLEEPLMSRLQSCLHHPGYRTYGKKLYLLVNEEKRPQLSHVVVKSCFHVRPEVYGNSIKKKKKKGF